MHKKIPTARGESHGHGAELDAERPSQLWNALWMQAPKGARLGEGRSWNALFTYAVAFG
jgi:hypothetical protein